MDGPHHAERGVRPLVLGAVAGLVIADAAGRVTYRWAWRWPPTVLGPRASRTGAIAALVLITVLVPPVAALALVGWWTRGQARRRRAGRAAERQVCEHLPDLVDLLALACTAGCSLPVAHPLVAGHTPAPLGPALMAAHEAAAAGRPRAEALVTALAPLGDRARALADVLVDHLRYGVPLLPGLERAGLELRLDRRHRAEQDARRVPVRLLAPLVTCVLPAFALLTVVPLLAASLDALPT
jgi:tight adherence protein C